MLAVAVFVVGILANFPARVAYRWLQTPEFMMNGIDGSVWNGGAAEMSINGVYLRDVRWDNHLSKLFLAQVSYDIEASPPTGFMRSTVSLHAGGKVSVADTRAAIPLSWIANDIGLRGLQGTANVTMERLELLDGLPIAADGEVQLLDVQVPIVSRDSLGSFGARVFTQNEGISASVEDLDAIVDLAGSFELTADRSFEFIGKIVTTSATPANLAQQLRQFYPANERGQHEVRLEGTL